MESAFVITIVGPESSGKTTLARELADRIGCSWVPEHAREFLSGLDHPYTFRDLEVLASKQWSIIQDVWPGIDSKQGGDIRAKMKTLMLQSQGFSMETLVETLRPFATGMLLIDGGMLTLQQWASIKYGKSIEIVEDVLQADLTSLYILTRARKEWQPDPLRESPDFLDRVWIFNQYMHALQRRGKAYVTGNVDVIQVSTA